MLYKGIIHVVIYKLLKLCKVLPKSFSIERTPAMYACLDYNLKICIK